MLKNRNKLLEIEIPILAVKTKTYSILICFGVLIFIVMGLGTL